MAIELFSHQQEAIKNLKSGSVLVGGVGTGKSLTAVGYYKQKHGTKDLYIITTAKKRDSLEWVEECGRLNISTDLKLNNGVKVIVDSWNNIGKYVDVKNSFFIFDEQRLVGAGTWVKTFLKIVKSNTWILLSATPGDTWSDYIPVFLANGFYKNRTEFLRRHAIFNRFAKFPQIDRYVETKQLDRLRNSICVYMDYQKKTTQHHHKILCGYDKITYKYIMKNRWNIYKEEPIVSASELCYTLRKLCNSCDERVRYVKQAYEMSNKIIVFYNYNYELNLIEHELKLCDIPYAQWNGHKHEPIPVGDRWIYLVQYTAGAEGWNCVETDTIVFYSKNYSYKIMEQAAGRIDRLNTKFINLNYYHLESTSPIDLAIGRALAQKKNFNERKFA